MTRAASTPTRRTAGSSPAPSTNTSARIATSWIDRHAAGRHDRRWSPRRNDHVDAINAAVQTARLAAGHLDPDLSVAIAGGEQAHRRRRRRHPPQRPPADHHAGEPVRNRETWTVTAIHPDGALTVTHETGHGTVTLAGRLRPRARPARLRGDRARLPVRHRHRRHRARLRGDDPPRPVRRRHPRPRREPDLRHHRQPTTSPRPATSSKPSSPSTGPTSPPSPNAATSPPNTRQRTRPASTAPRPGRCRIPDWFAELLADARHALAEAEHTVESRTVERARRAAAVTTAEGDLAVIDRATAPHREMLAVDAKRADQARVNHADGEASPRRQRTARPARGAP